MKKQDELTMLLDEAERSIRGCRVNCLINICNRTLFILSEAEAGYDSRSPDRITACVTYPEFCRNSTPFLKHTCTVRIDGLQSIWWLGSPQQMPPASVYIIVSFAPMKLRL